MNNDLTSVKTSVNCIKKLILFSLYKGNDHSIVNGALSGVHLFKYQKVNNSILVNDSSIYLRTLQKND